MDGLTFDVVVHAATALKGESMARHQSMVPTNALRTRGTENLLAAAFGAPKPLRVPLWLLKPAPPVHTCMTSRLRDLGWSPIHADSLRGVRALASARPAAA
ncbi:hypothetical protein R1T08_23160 [Streptomyces sp. SBC-4]|nr:hypothetical protein [Streptomyces sp. SBC-4]MDV5147006.1 hypothetical protein [Streptomyces sp. SBC-4]